MDAAKTAEPIKIRWQGGGWADVRVFILKTMLLTVLVGGFKKCTFVKKRILDVFSRSAKQNHGEVGYYLCI